MTPAQPRPTDRHTSPATSTKTRLGEAEVLPSPLLLPCQFAAEIALLQGCVCLEVKTWLRLPRHITCYSSVDSSSPTLPLKLRLRARVRKTRIIQRSISAAVQLLNPPKHFIFFRHFYAARFRCGSDFLWLVLSYFCEERKRGTSVEPGTESEQQWCTLQTSSCGGCTSTI